MKSLESPPEVAIDSVQAIETAAHHAPPRAPGGVLCLGVGTGQLKTVHHALD